MDQHSEIFTEFPLKGIRCFFFYYVVTYFSKIQSRYSNIEKSRLPESNFLESRDVSAFLNKHLMLLKSLEERVSGNSVKISDYWTFFHFRALLDSLIRRVEFPNVDN